MSKLAALRAHVFRWPVRTPVRTSFGVMHDRPMVLVEAQDADGAVGWGEIWCNFPAVGAEHRARLLESVFAPMLAGADVSDPAAVFESLEQRTAVLALQSGEPGPIAQCTAGVDIALWDLKARRAAKPLWRLLGGIEPTISAYASGLNPQSPEKLALRRRNEGFTAFKLKVGFGESRDTENLAAMRAALGEDTTLMVDANQAWDLPTARAMAQRLERFDLGWLEEPLRADTSLEEWKALRGAGRIPLAAGENMAGTDTFTRAIASGAFAVLQPDMAKWGGFSGCLPVARAIRNAGLRYCPHYLGGGIGLLASAHLLAAVGGDGMLEIDANDNPLRTEACGALSRIRDGRATLDESPGLGFTPDPAALARL